jgi:serine/threonine-protein kinase PknK
VTTSESGTTRFVGRHRDLASVRTLLMSTRLVTVTGPGGVGKSRLASHLLDRTDGDAWRVDVADVLDPSIVPFEIAHRLGLRPGPGSGAQATLARFFGDRPGLLVLDNVDHLLDVCRDLVEGLLEHCAHLRVVVTSRQALGAPSEHVVRLEPLSVPASLDDLTPERAGRSESVRLFVDRAVSVAPGFRLTQDNVASVARLCAALDGLPLAIELAAARSRELSPDELLARVEDRYRLLGPRFRDMSGHLASLEASVAWSHDSCSPREQQLWARLSVFVGGFETAAAEQVCAGDGIARDEVAGLVESLVAKSIVDVDREVDPPYHRMLTSVREYGAARLEEQPDSLRWWHRRWAWCGDLAAELAADWAGPRQAWWLDRMRRNHANLVATLNHGDDALQVLVDAEMYWVVSGSYVAARAWFDRLLALDVGTPELRYTASCLSALCGLLTLDPTVAAREVAALRSSEPSDPTSRARLAQVDSLLRLFAGDLDEGVEVAIAGVRDAELAGALALELNIRWLLALLLVNAGRPQEAADAVAAGLERSATVGDSYGRGLLLWLSGSLAQRRGDLDSAARLEIEALREKWALREQLGVALVLETLAAVAADQGRTGRQARLLGAAARVWRGVGLTPFTAPRTRAAHELQRRVSLGQVDEAFARAFEEGSALDTDDVVRELLEAPPGSLLSSREQQVAALVGEGLTNQQIASRLVISVRTVHGHMENILRKLGFGSRAQVAAWVVRSGVEAGVGTRVTPPASGS